MAKSALGGDLDGVLAEHRAFDQDGLVPVPPRTWPTTRRRRSRARP